jgi:DNA-binding transcriptional LysR family regulator
VELRQLRYFLAVADAGNFSRAAERLHISQPPLSMQIKALEREIGAQLLTRGNRGVTLTTAGSVFREETRALLARLEHARSKALQAGRGEIGTLSVGFVSIADYSILPPALRSFRARYPRVEVELHELTTDAQIRELRAERLDLGIALAPVDEPDLTFEAVLREPLLLAAPSAHSVLRNPGAIDLRALASASFIVPPREIAPGLYDLIISHCRSVGFTPRITQEARQMQTVIGLVAAGMGVALVPSSVRNLKRSGVRYRPLSGKAALVESGVLCPSGPANPLVERFTNVLRSAAPTAARSSR